VFQDTTLDDRLTARENLAFHGEIYGMTREDIHIRTTEMLERVGLDDRRDSLVMTFSGGMKRRLEIARGLMHHPTALFLDEPTIGLDPQTRRSLWEYAQSLRDTEGVTIFLTTHYMDEAEACDRIAIIDHGRIIALDTPAGLKARLGGDVVAVSGEDNQALGKEIQERFGVEPRVTDEDVEFRVERGDQFVPRLFAQLSSAIETVSIRRPTLDDVFVTLTGREIRDEGASQGDMARHMLRTRGGPPGMGRRSAAPGGRR
jgi:ABC-2 type transport system ATP-binding protein